MKVYKLSATEHTELVVPSPLTSSRFREATGARQGTSWEPVPVELRTQENGKPLESVDCPFFGPDFLVIKDAALPRVADYLEPYAEFLELDCPQARLSAINVTTIVDALDEEASETV